MKVIRYSERDKIKEVLKRGSLRLEEAIPTASKIMDDVRRRGDDAVIEYTKRFDGFNLTHKNIRVSRKEIKKAAEKIDTKLLSAIKHATKNITKFHREQMQRIERRWYSKISEGVLVGEKVTPIESVGCYVPGGRASYASTVLMNCIPAKVAGVKKISVVSPPPISDTILAAADVCGVNEVYRVGGAQAIAALAYGTESIKAVDKIVGPGNKYVMAAKMLAYGKVGLDMPAGPSEVLVIADETSNPRLIAADILAQAEHDPDARSVLVTDSEKIIEKTKREVSRQLISLKTKKTAEKSLKHAVFILTEKMTESIEFANAYAPEHLEVMTKNPEKIADRIRNAGAIFLGPWSLVAAGDYCSGGNHVLPTAGTARFASPLSVRDFLKTSSIQKINEKGLMSLYNTIQKMADSEGFHAHKKSAEERFR